MEEMPRDVRVGRYYPLAALAAPLAHGGDAEGGLRLGQAKGLLEQEPLLGSVRVGVRDRVG